MIIDEWQHLQQGDGTVIEYIARFDDLMIRCNIDEEPVATLARFWAGLRSEYQWELVLHEVTTLEKDYRYTTNMELYSAHAQRAGHAWSSSASPACYPGYPHLTSRISSQPIDHSLAQPLSLGTTSTTTTPSVPPVALDHV